MFKTDAKGLCMCDERKGDLWRLCQHGSWTLYLATHSTDDGSCDARMHRTSYTHSGRALAAYERHLHTHEAEKGKLIYTK